MKQAMLEKKFVNGIWHEIIAPLATTQCVDPVCLQQINQWVLLCNSHYRMRVNPDKIYLFIRHALFCFSRSLLTTGVYGMYKSVTR